MRSIVPWVTVFGLLMFGAAGSRAYAPVPGSNSAVLATEPAFTKVHTIGSQFHEDCRYGPVWQLGVKTIWHRHPRDKYWPRHRPCGAYRRPDGPYRVTPGGPRYPR
jgi:hypothetical protein